MKIDELALEEACAKLLRLRLTIVGGRKEIPIETVKSVLRRGLDGMYADEALNYILRRGLQYYLSAQHGVHLTRGSRAQKVSSNNSMSNLIISQDSEKIVLVDGTTIEMDMGMFNDPLGFIVTEAAKQHLQSDVCRAAQINWQEQCLFDCDDILTDVIHKLGRADWPADEILKREG